MNLLAIWFLILLQVCGSEYFDPLSFSDQTENQSPDNNKFINDLHDNWASPISHLRDSERYIDQIKDYKQITDKNSFPEERLETTKCAELINVDKSEPGADASDNKTEPPATNKTGIIKKVKNKFMSIFSSRLSNQSDERRNKKSDWIDLNEYDLYDREMFPRDVSEQYNSEEDDLFKNLSNTDIMFIKNFIKLFKDSRKQYEIQLTSSNITYGDRESATTTPSTESEETTENCNVQTTPEVIRESSTNHNAPSMSTSTDSVTPSDFPSSYPKTEADEITVDLDIDQKNGTGKVIMGDGRTTECTPLHLNDISFDLEWNKNKRPSKEGRERTNSFRYPFLRNNQRQRLASKFLQDVKSYPDKNKDHPETADSETILDSASKTNPDESDQALKMNPKREIPIKTSNYRRKHPTNDGYQPGINDEYSYKENSKRRTRFRAKNRKKSKHKSRTRPFKKTRKSDLESINNEDARNDYNSELNDLQFHVNSEDEEAISKFITNLNSPPELFSFDVDKYIHSAETDEPKSPKFEAPEERTNYEFIDSPAVDTERLPPMENPALDDDDQDSYGRTDKKRDLLRQYIKAASYALSHNDPQNCVKTKDYDNSQKRSNNFDDGYKPKERDEFLDNYYLLNDGSTQILNSGKQNTDGVNSEKYPSKNIEMDMNVDMRLLDPSLGPRPEDNLDGDGPEVAEIDNHASELN